MGIFAFYNGMIYNEAFAIPLKLFGSCYTDTPIDRFGEKVYVRKDHNCVYTIGVDPVWFLSDQELAFTNNLKMKIAVILGVMQMSLGIVMKAFNNIHFGKMIDFFFEFIPQILLLIVLFGWMDMLIVVKWLRYMTIDNPNNDPIMREKIHYAPAIITSMIDMFLSPGSSPDEDVKDYVLLFNG